MSDHVTPVDPDVDRHVPVHRAEARPNPAPVLAAISAGGAVGALARYGMAAALPHPPGSFAWDTVLVNVSGCLLVGVLMTLVGEVWGERRLVRPFLGVGVLGGYTTFSTFVVDIHQQLAAGAAGTALGYLGATLVGAMVAVWAGAAATARVIRRRPGRMVARITSQPADSGVRP